MFLLINKNVKKKKNILSKCNVEIIFACYTGCTGMVFLYITFSLCCGILRNNKQIWQKAWWLSKNSPFTLVNLYIFYNFNFTFFYYVISVNDKSCEKLLKIIKLNDHWHFWVLKQCTNRKLFLISRHCVKNESHC